jgi:hypothetical protein
MNADEVYRAIVEHVERQSRWRERLFEGYLVVLGALGGSYYIISRAERQIVPSWVIPGLGTLVALLFLLLHNRVSEAINSLVADGKAFAKTPWSRR